MEVRRIPNWDELYHHGIKGQEWGVRNGPPYPLDQKKEIKQINKAVKKNYFLSSGAEKYGQKSKAVRSVIKEKELTEASNKLHDSYNDTRDYVEKKIRSDPQTRKEAKKLIQKTYDQEDIDAFGMDELIDIEIFEDPWAIPLYKKAAKKVLSEDETARNKVQSFKNLQKQHKEIIERYAKNIVGDLADVKLSKSTIWYKDKTYKDFVTEAIQSASSNASSYSFTWEED